MARYRRKKSRGGGGGGGRGGFGNFGGLITSVFGGIMMIVSLIGFNIIIGQIDTAYTSAATYTEQVGLTDIMGIVPLIFFVVIMAVGIGALVAGGVIGFKKGSTLNPMDVIMAIINGVISAVIAMILWGIIQTNLHTSYTTANATTNIASFSGLLSIMGIWGIVILVSLVGNAVANFAGIGYGGYKKITGKM